MGNTGAAGSPGINGGGGSGGAYGFVGGAGSQDSIWTQTSDGTRAGPGGGPGAGSGGPNGGAIVGYGAGAAGYNLGGSANIKGGNGIIVLTYSLSGPIAVSSWKDVSGNDNHSTVVGNAVYATTGGIGSLQFNGVSQYAVAPNSSSLQITTGTIGAWFKANNTNAGYNGIIAKQNAWGLFVMDNILVAYDWGNVAMRTTGITVGNDTWNFVAMSFTETKGTPANNAIVYLNGTAVLTTTVKHLAHDVTVQVGEANASQFFGGNISMAFVYNRVLSAQEIQQNFNAMRARFGI